MMDGSTESGARSGGATDNGTWDGVGQMSGHAPGRGSGQVPGASTTVIWVVAAAVLDDAHTPRRLLAARRTEPPGLAGGWELPGGKVDPEESAEQALHREIAEELGVTVGLGTELIGAGSMGAGLGESGSTEGGSVDDLPGWTLSPPYRMRVWPAVIVGGDPAPIEDHDALVWLEPGRWLDIGWLPSNLPIVRALLARYPTAAAANPT